MKQKVCLVEYSTIDLFPEDFHPKSCHGVVEVAGIVPVNVFNTPDWEESDYLIIKSSVNQKMFYELDDEVIEKFDIKYGTSKRVLLDAVRYQEEELPKIQAELEAKKYVKVLPLE